MKTIEEVLHKPTPPPNTERWHIIMKGHPEELLDALAVVIEKEPGVIQTAEWTAVNELTICLNWIGHGFPQLVENDILDDSQRRGNDTKFKHNGRKQCLGHNMPSQT